MLALSTAASRGQNIPALEFYTPVQGQIVSSADIQIWEFEAPANSVISILVESTSEGFDPVLRVSDVNEREIIANDDYDYPAVRDALVEAITVPFTGVYRVAVTGFGGSTGTFILTLLRGYGDLVYFDSFDNAVWQPINPDDTVQVEDEGLALSAVGVRESTTAINTQAPLFETFYAEARVRTITSQNPWTVGLTLRQQQNSFYAFLVNASGLWRFVRFEDGQESTIRDWTPHPAIVPSAVEIAIGVLAHGAGFDLFYNGQFVGQAHDPALSAAGRIGLLAATADALNSRLEVVFDHVLVTVPVTTATNGVFPLRLMPGTDTQIIQELERRRLIPAGGQMALTVPESFVDSGRPGVALQPLGRGMVYRNLVIATTMTMTQNARAGLAACGLLVRNVDDTTYTIAYLDNQGAYGVSERNREQFSPGIYGENMPLNASNSNQILVILNEDVLFYYINGIFAGNMRISPVEGQIGNALINFELADTNCRFTNTWLWRW